MATLLSSYKDIAYTILPHSLNAELQEELLQHPGNNVIGYAIYNKSKYEFIYTNSEEFIGSKEHWSLDILKNIPYCNYTDTCIVFNCPPHKTKDAFRGILRGETLHIDHWDTWSIDGMDAKVAVLNSWEIF